jgi:hypothetical protein
MKQILGEKNQSGLLDPEKAYFVEKFGYLVKNINSGYGGPIQEALIKRIYFAVDQFRSDLPDVVRDIEIKRLKDIEEKQKLAAEQKVKIESEVVEEKTIEPEAPKVEEKTEEIIPDIKTEDVNKSQPEVVKESIETEIEISTKDEAPIEEVEKPVVESKSTILRPSAAAIIEENRQRQLRKIQEEKLAKKENDIAPLVMRPNVKPKKELTVWERAWHRYGGYTDEVMNGHS